MSFRIGSRHSRFPIVCIEIDLHPSPGGGGLLSGKFFLLFGCGGATLTLNDGEKVNGHRRAGPGSEKGYII